MNASQPQSNNECQSDITLALGKPHLSSSAALPFWRADRSPPRPLSYYRGPSTAKCCGCVPGPWRPCPRSRISGRPVDCGGFFWTRRPCLASFSCEAAASSRSWARAWSRRVMVAFVGTRRRRLASLASRCVLPCGSSLWGEGLWRAFFGAATKSGCSKLAAGKICACLRAAGTFVLRVQRF